MSLLVMMLSRPKDVRAGDENGVEKKIVQRKVEREKVQKGCAPLGTGRT